MGHNTILGVDEIPPHAICYPNPTPECVGRRASLLRRAGVRAVVSEGKHLVGGLRVLGRGHAAVVFKAILADGRIAAVKVLRTDSKRESLLTECELMIRAAPVAPAVIKCFDELIVMEFIDGVSLGDVVEGIVKRHTCSEVPHLIARVLGATRYLDIRGVDHKELSIPRKHVMLSNGAVRIIDYESARPRERPCNVCRVVSWFVMRSGLWRECCGDPEDALATLTPALRRYRRSCTPEEFKNVLLTLLNTCRASLP